jgi:ATP-binding cassette subfamily F protein 3
VDAATGMFKAVKQVAAVASSTHEMEGALGDVTPTPKASVKRLNPIKLKHLEERVAAVEDELPELEARILAAEQQQGFFTTAEAAQALASELDGLREQHAARTAEWEELAMQLEEQSIG